jgi:hypothetical protein
MDATTVDWLNALLCDELAAVETYLEALTERRVPLFGAELWKCKRSHEARVNILREAIVALGGTPTASCGLNDILEQMAEVSGAEVDEEMIVRILAAGEVQILRDYHLRIPKLDRETRLFVERELLPAEEYTHEALGALVGLRASAR